MVAKKRIMSKAIKKTGNSSTVSKAGITASLEYTRGKELVEHNPWSLIPDPNNPRPREVIDDVWMKRVLKLGYTNSLCFYDGSGNWIIPDFDSLSGDLNGAKKDDYDFLVQLSKSIRVDGLIEPIEIFLADKSYEPDYFVDNNLEHGYVVLEGHQRRLAALIGGIDKVTCIKITDDTLLAKLKVKHRKLRRQLSENNLRKEITPAQHYLIVKDLFSSLDKGDDLTGEQLSEITGLNLKISQVLKKIVIAKEGRYPNILYQKLIGGELSMRALRGIAFKTFEEISDFFSNADKSELPKEKLKSKVKPISRGTSGGRVKKSAIFKISSSDDSLVLSQYLIKAMPNLKLIDNEPSSYKQLENILQQLMDKAKLENA
tara:strand:- start:713 stop:1831 length:1119 start_codon:yes stop_codon:yes gene_type:complete